jgi:hypothetical protein
VLCATAGIACPPHPAFSLLAYLNGEDKQVPIRGLPLPPKLPGQGKRFHTPHLCRLRIAAKPEGDRALGNRRPSARRACLDEGLMEPGHAEGEVPQEVDELAVPDLIDTVPSRADCVCVCDGV